MLTIQPALLVAAVYNSITVARSIQPGAAVAKDSGADRGDPDNVSNDTAASGADSADFSFEGANNVNTSDNTMNYTPDTANFSSRDNLSASGAKRSVGTVSSNYNARDSNSHNYVAEGGGPSYAGAEDAAIINHSANHSFNGVNEESSTDYWDGRISSANYTFNSSNIDAGGGIESGRNSVITTSSTASSSVRGSVITDGANHSNDSVIPGHTKMTSNRVDSDAIVTNSTVNSTEDDDNAPGTDANTLDSSVTELGDHENTSDDRINRTIPTDAPTTPTLAPTAPTPAPTLPTAAPTEPTPTPTSPTSTTESAEPTPAPTLPTPAPVVPTPAPTSPTLAPTAPTLAPTSPTVVPTSPTLAPTSPTVAPTAPTPTPTSPTMIPTPPALAPTPPSSAPTNPTPAPSEPTLGPTAPTQTPTIPTSTPTAPSPAPTTAVPTAPTSTPATVAPTSLAPSRLSEPTQPTPAITTTTTITRNVQQVTGSLSITVDDPEAFVNSPDAYAAVKASVEESAGLEVIEMTLSVESRRLAAKKTGRRLQSSTGGIVSSQYTLAAPPDGAVAAAGALHQLSRRELTTLLAQHLQLNNASMFAPGLSAQPAAVILLAYDVFGQMGGSVELLVTPAIGFQEKHEASPARWNAWQPRSCSVGSRWRCACPRLSHVRTASIRGPLFKAVADGHDGIGDACNRGVLPAPPNLGAVLVARRGGCSFFTKVEYAERLSYCGLLVVGDRAGPPHPFYGVVELPEMTAAPGGSDAVVGIPAWFVSSYSGQRVLSALEFGTVRVEVMDVVKRPALGFGQEDVYGPRDYQGD